MNGMRGKAKKAISAILAALLLCACFAAPGGGWRAAGIGDMPVAYASGGEAPPAGVPVARFDFGSEQSPVAAGWTKATPLTAYDAAAGYGWKNDAR
ncbi:MAG: hypothetical protein LBJ10_06435, partial [Clostridiales bacterium]|nr:hypothetical protein [Clostridiales bacterium]